MNLSLIIERATTNNMKTDTHWPKKSTLVANKNKNDRKNMQYHIIKDIAGQDKAMNKQRNSKNLYQFIQNKNIFIRLFHF